MKSKRPDEKFDTEPDFRERVLNAIEEELQGNGYRTKDWYVEKDLNQDGTIDWRVYVAVIRLAEEEFFKRYSGLGRRKVTFGNMCEVEVMRSA